MILNGKPLPWGIPDPVGLYLLASVFIKMFSWKYGIPLLSLFASICTAICLFLIYRLMRDFTSPKWSALTLAYFATLPVLVTTSVVFASDGFILLPFFLYSFLLYHLLLGAKERNKFPWVVIVIAAIQIIGIFIKFTYLALIPASFLAAIFIIYSDIFAISKIKKYAIAGFIFVIPALVNITSFLMVIHPEKLGVSTVDKHTMKMRSYLPYFRDIDLLKAPSLGDPILKNGRQILVDLDGNEDPKGELGFQLLVENKYSYPMLIHLAIHTDIRNLALGEMTPSSSRTRSNQISQNISVLLGIFLSIGVLVFNFDFLIQNIKYLIKNFGNRYVHCNKKIIFFIAVWIPGFMWFCLIALSLKFVSNPVFRWGYWTPRLILPAVLVFGMILFFGSTRLKGAWLKLFIGLVILQIFLAINILVR